MVEVGYKAFTNEEANLFFRLVSYRYQRWAICITSNKAVKEWPEMLARRCGQCPSKAFVLRQAEGRTLTDHRQVGGGADSDVKTGRPAYLAYRASNTGCRCGKRRNLCSIMLL